MREPLPLATLHEAILEFLTGRDDAVVFGAQAVNAYVSESRMTQDVDLLSTRAAELAEEIRNELAGRFHIAVRIRAVGADAGYRVYQVRRPENRHLVDVRPVAELPDARRIAGLLILAPADLIAAKVIALVARRGQPKSGTDWRDLAMLLLAFPALKADTGAVRDRLIAGGAGLPVLEAWSDLVAQEILPEDEDDEFRRF